MVKINVLSSVSGIYLFSSLSFSVYYGVFKSRMCNLTFDFILHLYWFFRCFCSFLFPLKVCIADRSIGQILSWSFWWWKLPNRQMHKKLGFIWKTYPQPAIGVIVMLPGWGPRGPGAPGSVPNAKPSKARNKQIYPFGTEQLNGLTAKSPGIQANEGLCPTACARAELGWGRESGCGIGVMDVTDAAWR